MVSCRSTATMICLCLHTTGKVIKLYDQGFFTYCFSMRAMVWLIEKCMFRNQGWRVQPLYSPSVEHIYHSPIHIFQYVMDLLKKVAASANRDGTTTRENWHDCLLGTASWSPFLPALSLKFNRYSAPYSCCILSSLFVIFNSPNSWFEHALTSILVCSTGSPSSQYQPKCRFLKWYPSKCYENSAKWTGDYVLLLVVLVNFFPPFLIDSASLSIRPNSHSQQPTQHPSSPHPQPSPHPATRHGP